MITLSLSADSAEQAIPAIAELAEENQRFTATEVEAVKTAVGKYTGKWPAVIRLANGKASIEADA